MENVFKSYDPIRLSKSKIYAPGGDWEGFKSIGHDHREICSNCHKSYGLHIVSENNCPPKCKI
jgi:hypothetical protein